MKIQDALLMYSMYLNFSQVTTGCPTSHKNTKHTELNNLKYHFSYETPCVTVTPVNTEGKQSRLGTLHAPSLRLTARPSTAPTAQIF
jgi:hypothetical protein